MFDNTEIAFSHFGDKELKKAARLFRLLDNNLLVKTGPALTNFALRLGLPVLPLIRSTIYDHFCGGETIADCEDNIAHLWQYRVGTILDYSVEGGHSEEDFDTTAAEILGTIGRARRDEKVPFSVFKLSGIARTALLAKRDSGEALSPEESEEFERVRARVDRICRESAAAGVPVLIDAEESWIQDSIDELAMEMMARYNRQRVLVYNTYQLYRKDRLALLESHIRAAREGSFLLGAKLVRGAYMEKERERAAEKGYPSPVHDDKAGSDFDFDAAAELCIAHLSQVAFMAGTHNEASCLKLVKLMEEKGVAPGDRRIYFAQLLGMSDNISFNLAYRGYCVAKYMPYGPVRAVLPYLFRRAQENTAIAGQMGRELRLILEELRRRKAKEKGMR